MVRHGTKCRSGRPSSDTSCASHNHEARSKRKQPGPPVISRQEARCRPSGTKLPTTSIVWFDKRVAPSVSLRPPGMAELTESMWIPGKGTLRIEEPWCPPGQGGPGAGPS